MDTFNSKARFPFVLVGIVVVVASMLWTSATALAAPQPQQTNAPTVVVVRDTTASMSCKLTWGVRTSTANIALKTATCPTGTLLSTFQIPLSVVRATGEKYVVLPARTASKAAQAQVKQEIFALFATTEARYHPAFSASEKDSLSPLTCSPPYSYYVSANWSPSFDHSTSYYSEMDYERCGGSALYLNSSYIQLNSGFGYYWDHDQYAAGNWGRGCQAISTNGNTGGLNSSHTAGYYYEPYVSNGSSCTIFDSYSYVNIGPAR